jgi:hypothetical protein
MSTIPNLGAAWPWPTIKGPRGHGSPSWFETTREVYDNQLGAVPPIYFRGGFMASEPADHDARGVPIYAALVEIGDRCFVREVAEDAAAASAAALRATISVETCDHGPALVCAREAARAPVVEAPEWLARVRGLDRIRGHEFMPAAVLAALPPLYSQDGKGYDAVAQVRYFAGGAAVWYLTEIDAATGEAFGWADMFGDSGELGYCSLEELGTTRGLRGMPVELDCWFKPKPLRACEEVARQMPTSQTCPTCDGRTKPDDEGGLLGTGTCGTCAGAGKVPA